MAAKDLLEIAGDHLHAYNARDWSRFKASLASGVVYDELGTQRRMQGTDQMVDAWDGWVQALPDLKGTITASTAGDQTVCVEISWEGTHTGPLSTPSGTIPPSGKSIKVPSAWVITFEGDKIREGHMYFDLMTLLQQIGAMPAPQ